MIVIENLNSKNVEAVSIIENGSWGPAVIRKASEILESMKNMRILEQKISIKSALHDLEPIEKMADENPELQENTRFIMCLFRAKCDMLVKSRRVAELKLIKAAKSAISARKHVVLTAFS